MIVRVGYGFEINDLLNDKNEQAILEFIRTYDKCMYEEVKNEIYYTKGKYYMDIILSCIRTHYDSFGDYIQRIINSEEKRYAKLNDDVLELYGDYLVFTGTNFIDDKSSSLYIRNAEMFKNMIHRYFPVKNIRFGYIYTGEEWLDEDYYMGDK